MYASLTSGRSTNAIGVASDAYISVGQWWAVRETLRCYLNAIVVFGDKYTVLRAILEGLKGGKCILPLLWSARGVVLG